jgi:hypothetical protein
MHEQSDESAASGPPSRAPSGAASEPAGGGESGGGAGAGPEAFDFGAPPAEVDRDAPPRCLRCGYVLTGLTEPRCPECGARFDPADTRTFTFKPPLLRWRLWGPGLALALVLGVAQAAILIYYGSFGWALVFAVPLAVGTILGYGVRARHFVSALLAMIVVPALIFGLITLDQAGLFCGFALTGLFLGPALVGALAGAALRVMLKSSRFSQGPHLPVLGLVVLGIGPIVGGFFEQAATGPLAIERVRTTVVLDAPPRQVWDAMLFFGDVRAEPPWLAQLALPHPVRVEGRLAGVGDRRRCVYSKGHLVKEVTTWRPDRRLGFDVVAQKNVEDRSVALRDGAFVLDPIAGGRKTRLSLVTRYRPLLQARAAWRPMEHYTVHALHRHVLRAMRHRLDAGAAPGPMVKAPR